MVITGDGGDEIFGGYRWYPKTLIHKFKQNVANVLYGRDECDKHKGLFNRSTLHMHSINLYPRFLPEEASYLLGIDSATANDLFMLRPLINSFNTHLPVMNALQRLDLMSFCTNHICRKTDEMSMAYGLEVRSPFLDRRFITWAIRHKSQHNSSSGSKVLLRRYLAENHIPREVVGARKKGFSMQFLNFNFQSLLSEIKDIQFVINGEINANYEEILSNPISTQNARIWSLASLSLWYQYNN